MSILSKKTTKTSINTKRFPWYHDLVYQKFLYSQEYYLYRNTDLRFEKKNHLEFPVKFIGWTVLWLNPYSKIKKLSMPSNSCKTMLMVNNKTKHQHPNLLFHSLLLCYSFSLDIYNHINLVSISSLIWTSS